MPAFHYTALNSAEKTVSGIIESDSERLARQALRAQGLFPLTLNPVRTVQKKQSSFFLLSKKIKLTDLALLTRQLSTLLGAGLPIVDSLKGVIDQTSPSHVKSLLHDVRSRVLEGHSLADALHSTNGFSELYCATIRSGEHTGKLDKILDRLADHIEQQVLTHQKVQQALIYPTLMTGISIAIVCFLLIFVVPRIINVFDDLGQTLPQITLILIAVSHGLQAFGLYILLGIILSILTAKRLLHQPAIKFSWHLFLLKIPLVGRVIKTSSTALYARTLGILSASGVDVLEAMRVSASLLTNRPMIKAISDAATKVREGIPIHRALEQTHFFSPMTLHLIANGEKTGRLEEMLERAARNQEMEVKRIIDATLTLFEPFIILVMGGVVLFIVLSILLPIFELDQFNG